LAETRDGIVMIGTSDCRLVISGKSLFVRNRIGCDGGRREGGRSGVCLESCTSSTPEKMYLPTQQSNVQQRLHCAKHLASL